MAITYTKSWQRGRIEGLDTREFPVELTIVSDDAVLTPANIFTAVDSDTSAAFPKINDRSEFDTKYFLHRISAPRMAGPRFAVVSLVYRIGAGKVTVDDDPLNTPTRYRVQPGISSERTDADVHGNPLLNSAGDPFGAFVQGAIATLTIHAIRNEPAYDIGRAIGFTNKINDDTFTLAGNPILPGEAWCLSITPAEYSLIDEFVEVTYSFEIRENIRLANGGKITAFIHRILDQGKRGHLYGGDGLIVQIMNKNGEAGEYTPVADDVPLQDGRPLNWEDVGTSDGAFDPTAGLNQFGGWFDQGRLNGSTATDIDPNTGVNFLLYDKHIARSFGELNL